MKFKQLPPFIVGVLVGAILACNDRPQSATNVSPTPTPAPVASATRTAGNSSTPSPSASASAATPVSPERIEELAALADPTVTPALRRRAGGGNQTLIVGGDGYLMGYDVKDSDGNTICSDPFAWTSTKEIECD